MSKETQTLLEMVGITKIFPGTVALDGVDFMLRRGEVHCLVGENGAGKSTLVKVLSGVYPPEKGEIRLDGEEVKVRTPFEARKLGIEIVSQEPELVPDISVAENIFLGRVPKISKGSFVIDWHALSDKAEQVLRSCGFDIDPRQHVSELSTSNRHLAAVAKAVAGDPKILILDEPTAALGGKEVEALFALVKRLVAKGTSIIYVSHRLEELFLIGDRITVLKDGKRVSTEDVKTITQKELVKLMVGREIGKQYGSRQAKIGQEILEMIHVSDGETLKDATLTVREGEVVGLSGLVGAGKTEVLKSIAGASKVEAGEMMIFGKSRVPRSPREALKMGVGYVTEDRKHLGLVMNLTVGWNILTSVLPRLCRHGIIQYSQCNKVINDSVSSLKVNPPEPLKISGELSGGNQQKVVLGKVLAMNPRLVLLDEPTKGVDVGAKEEIYGIINRLAESGVGILLASSEMPELIGLSDRIVIMRDGTTVAELAAEEANEEAILRSAIGG